VFRDEESAMKAIQALGIAISPEESPDGLGRPICFAPAGPLEAAM